MQEIFNNGIELSLINQSFRLVPVSLRPIITVSVEMSVSKQGSFLLIHREGLSYCHIYHTLNLSLVYSTCIVCWTHLLLCLSSW